MFYNYNVKDFTLKSFIEEKIYPEFKRNLIMYFNEHHQILNIENLFIKNKLNSITLNIIPENYHKIIIKHICESLEISFFSKTRKLVKYYQSDILKNADDLLIRFIYSKEFIQSFIPPEYQFKILNCYLIKIKRKNK